MEDSGNSLKLLSFWSSPFSLRVRVALKLKGLEYDIQEEDIFNNKSELLLRSNPYKKIPVLIHNGKAICESMNIVQYLDELWPEPAFFPSDPFGRATARFWADYVDEKFLSLSCAGFRALFSSGEAREKDIEEYSQDLYTLEEALDKLAGDKGPFFGGEKMGYVDIALSFMPWWMPVYSEYGISVPNLSTKCPRIAKWMETVRNSPDATAVFPDDEVLGKFLKQRIEAFKMQNNN